MNLIPRAARTAILGGVVAASALATSACAEQGAVGKTTTTSAYVPGSVDLYMARTSNVGACGTDLPQTIEFAPRSAEVEKGEMVDLDRWAACLKRPELEHATLVLVGGDIDHNAESVFVERARRIRDLLAARGVDPGRVVIGAPNATREGGAGAPPTAVRLEMSTSTTLRQMPPSDVATMRGVR